MVSKGGYRVHGGGSFVLKEGLCLLLVPQVAEDQGGATRRALPCTLSHTARASLLLLQTRSLPFTLPLVPTPFLPFERELQVPALPSLIPSLILSTDSRSHVELHNLPSFPTYFTNPI